MLLNFPYGMLNNLEPVIPKVSQSNEGQKSNMFKEAQPKKKLMFLLWLWA